MWKECWNLYREYNMFLASRKQEAFQLWGPSLFLISNSNTKSDPFLLKPIYRTHLSKTYRTRLDVTFKKPVHVHRANCFQLTLEKVKLNYLKRHLVWTANKWRKLVVTMRASSFHQRGLRNTKYIHNAPLKPLSCTKTTSLTNPII